MYLHPGHDTFSQNPTPVLFSDPKLRWELNLTPNLNPAAPHTTQWAQTKPLSHPASTYNTLCDPMSSVLAQLHARLGLRMSRAMASFIQKEHVGHLVAASLCPSPQGAP